MQRGEKRGRRVDVRIARRRDRLAVEPAQQRAMARRVRRDDAGDRADAGALHQPQRRDLGREAVAPIGRGRRKDLERKALAAGGNAKDAGIAAAAQRRDGVDRTADEVARERKRGRAVIGLRRRRHHHRVASGNSTSGNSTSGNNAAAISRQLAQARRPAGVSPPAGSNSTRATPDGKLRSVSTSTRSSTKCVQPRAEMRASFSPRLPSKKTFSRGIAYLPGSKKPRAAMKPSAAARRLTREGSW